MLGNLFKKKSNKIDKSKEFFTKLRDFNSNVKENGIEFNEDETITGIDAGLSKIIKLEKEGNKEDIEKYLIQLSFNSLNLQVKKLGNDFDDGIYHVSGELLDEKNGNGIFDEFEFSSDYLSESIERNIISRIVKEYYIIESNKEGKNSDSIKNSLNEIVKLSTILYCRIKE